jgi:MFS family permease
MTASTYTQLYVGTLIFALANGTVEAVTNPAVATLYPREKVKYLNILHAGWPGGLVVGGLLFIAMGDTSWQLKIGLFLLPAVIYGVMMLGCKFPVQERVSAGVSYAEMLREFGWAGCLVVSYFVAGAVDAVISTVVGQPLPTAIFWAITLVPTIAFAVMYKSAGRPIFIFLLLVMILLATTELGTDGWVTDLLNPLLQGNSYWVLVYTSAIMFVLRVFGSGPLARRLNPVALLLVSAVLAATGLVFLANAGAAPGMIFIAATLYGLGKTYFWPTTLGLVSEQVPKGGALTLSGMGGMGMIAVGVLGAPMLGALQDQKLDQAMSTEQPAIYAQVARPPQTFPLIRGVDTGVTAIGPFRPLDQSRIAALPENERSAAGAVIAEHKQRTLLRFAVLPTLMALAYAGLLLYFSMRGGYKAVELGGGH